MRSRHTGHVGNSTREGVGGAIGFVLRVADDNAEEGAAAAVEGWASGLICRGVKGSLLISGKDS